MRALLDTNILIHREAAVIVRQDIGVLFHWLDRLGYEKWVHPASLEEVSRHRDARVRSSFAAKLASYRVIQALAPIAPEVAIISKTTDTTANDGIDSSILNELFVGHADVLITEDKGLAAKAVRLGVEDRVLTIEEFLEKATAENPELVDYKVLGVRRTLCGNVDVRSNFFESFRCEYPGFDRWFARKSQEPCYVCLDGNAIAAFLFLKLEGEREPYSDINPRFTPKRRLKIGTFKVALNGFKLGERFLKIVFDNALRHRVDEIYVTIFPNSVVQDRLVDLLEQFGFRHHGQKLNPYGAEEVYTRDMTPRFNAAQPSTSFPYVGHSARCFLVPIYPEYHTELLPDSILKTESPAEFVEPQPHRNAIRKVYVSRSYFRSLRSGDTLVFYRTGGFHHSVVTTLATVEGVHLDVKDEDHFIRLCRRRSVFTDADLRKQWRYKSSSRPFVVDFLYSYSFPKRPNMEALIKDGVIRDVNSAPRGFEQISREQVDSILRLSKADVRVVVD